jgi:hypothetical protein
MTPYPPLVLPPDSQESWHRLGVWQARNALAFLRVPTIGGYARPCGAGETTARGVS